MNSASPLAAIGYQSEIITLFAYQATIPVVALSLLVGPAWILLVRFLVPTRVRRN